MSEGKIATLTVYLKNKKRMNYDHVMNFFSKVRDETGYDGDFIFTWNRDNNTGGIVVDPKHADFYPIMKEICNRNKSKN